MQKKKSNLVVTDLPPCRKNRQANHISIGFGSDDGCKVRGYTLKVMSRGPHVSVYRGEMTTEISIYKAPFKGVITQFSLFLALAHLMVLNDCTSPTHFPRKTTSSTILKRHIVFQALLSVPIFFSG